MTQTEIAIQQAAELAAGSAVDCFGEDIPNAQTAWDFINDQIYAEEGRPLHLPDVMPNGFGPLYLVAAAKLIREAEGGVGMSQNTHILLPSEARPEDVLRVLGLLCGKLGRLVPLTSDSIHLEVDEVKLEALVNQFGCGRLIVDGVCSLFCIASSQHGMRGDYAVKTGMWISCPCTDFYQKLGVELVRFFGGEVDFNDCDSVDIDFAWAMADDLMAVNGKAWEDFQKRMFSVQPLPKASRRSA